jgi:predicted ArsR family transcriptional regulator
MDRRDKILHMLEKKNRLTFEEITDELIIDYYTFRKIITSLQHDELVIVDETKETVNLKDHRIGK